MPENSVDPVDLHRCQYLFCYRSKIQTLRDLIEKLELKKAYVKQLVDAANNSGKSIKPIVIDWLKQVDDLKKEADDIFMHMENAKMNCFNVRLPNLKSHFSLERDAVKRTNEVKKLLGDQGKFDEVGYIDPLEEISFIESTALPLEPEGLASWMSAKKEVMRILELGKTRLVAICGVAGVGKTTLVKQIVDHFKLGDTLSYVAMVTMDKSPNMIRNAQDQLVEQLEVRSDRGRIHNILNNSYRGNLIVLDGVSKEVDLRSIGIPVSNRSRVIVTSQCPSVCKNMGAEIVEVNAFPDEESYCLFKKAAGISDGSVLSDIAKTFVEECKGVPLAILVVARALRANCKTLHSWTHALEKLKKYTSRESEGVVQDMVFSVIEWSYDSLENVEAKSLLLLCSLFPEDYSIPVERLVRYSEGLEWFKERQTLREIRCRVDMIVNDLRSYHLLLGDSEKEDHVKLHDAVRDACLKIASKGEHVFLVRNAAESREQEAGNQQLDSFGTYTAISLTSEGSDGLFPFGMECPRLKLLHLVFLSGKHNLSKNSFIGMEDLRVMELNGSHIEFSLSCPGQMLTSLRTLCLDGCVLGAGTSTMLGCMTQLEILSLFNSKLEDDQLLVEIPQLSNLRMLDLRVKKCLQPLPCGVLSSLKKLEELYLGSRHQLPLGRDKEEERGCLEEIVSLSCLECLHIYVNDRIYANNLNFLYQFLHQLPIQKLSRFFIIGANYNGFSGRNFSKEYPFRNTLELETYNPRDEFIPALDPIVTSIVRNAENLRLHDLVSGLRSLVSDLDEDGLVDLKRLEMKGGVYECLIESTTSLVGRRVFENLASMELKDVSLDEICHGNLPPGCFSQLQEMKLEGTYLKYLWKGPIEPPSLCNLRTVEVSNCHRLTTLFPQSSLKCLVKLQKIVLYRCRNLERIIGRDESLDKEVLELPQLKTLVMRDCYALKAFGCEDDSKSSSVFLNQVSLPRLEALQVNASGYRPELLLGDEIRIGFLEKLKYLTIRHPFIRCIAKAEPVTTLRNLEKLQVSSSHKMQLLFDFEGLKVPAATGEHEILHKLEFLILHEASELTQVWRNFPRGVRVFANLRKLDAWSCNFQCLFEPPRVANMLVNLEVLEIAECGKMYGVIGGELGEEDEIISEEADTGKDGGSSASERSNKKLEFVFPKLSSLILISLPNLLSFGGSQRADSVFKFPYLTRLEILSCGKLKQFCPGKLDAPNLEEIKMIEKDNNIPVDLKNRKVIFQGSYTIRKLYRTKR